MIEYPEHAAAKQTVPGDLAIKWLVETFQRPYFFVHIPKCGGTAVADALKGYYLHGKAREWRQKTGGASWDSLRTFALVRRPYERVCSLYRYRSQIAEGEEAGIDLSLNDWVAEALEDRDPEALDTEMSLHPCLPWVVDHAGAPLVKLVCRLEEIDDDWTMVQRLTQSDVDLPMRNRTERLCGTTVSDLNARSRAIIEDYYAADFDNFGYRRIGAAQKLRPKAEAPMAGVTEAAYAQ
ncbi:sulfotransferase family protein [Epibacterium sp. MM17-32]|uniref:sulfotransferase family 2 domain-containing protein n=1 Tax=Epibacterium sp. MM17-32 TaxID=2917734 RepID=UPI001EF697CB|nr:sulfotransferase family 2 domain-containing protein [Epibacterium sp. MM17-32]MCG7628835.1 sulfotransferase family protein [Epibacterium sp. MM17-32]